MAGTEKVLIIGGMGLLGKYLRRLTPPDISVTATWCSKAPMGHQPEAWREMDLSDDGHIATAFEKVEPDYVVLAAAEGNVDVVERDWTGHTYDINVHGVRLVAKQATKHGASLLYVSSNAVYHGDRPLYRESDQRRPVNAYGWYRVMAEDIVRHNMPSDKGSIVRPILMYGWPEERRRGNWTTMTLEKMKDGSGLITPVNDVMTQPLYAEDCARFIWQVIMQNLCGEWNIAGLDRVTYLEYTRAIFDVWGFPYNRIKPITSADLDLTAPRPADTSYDLQSIRNMRFPLRGLREGLQAMKDNPC